MEDKIAGKPEAQGQSVVLAPGNDLPFGDSTVDDVFMNNVPPLDSPDGFFGPSFTTEEVKRVLKDTGNLFIDGKLQ